MTASDQNMKSTRHGVAQNLHTFRIISLFFQITKFKNLQIIYYFMFIYQLKLEMKLEYFLSLKQCFMQPNLKCPLSWEKEVAWLKTMWESCVKLSAEIQTNAQGSQRFQVLGQIKTRNRHFVESVYIKREKQKPSFSTFKIYNFLFWYKNTTLHLSDATLHDRQFYLGI